MILGIFVYHICVHVLFWQLNNPNWHCHQETTSPDDKKFWGKKKFPLNLCGNAIS